ncbi:hypothetical protein [Microbulbifer sp. 2205BS26-8]|uniref:hypothetical protein n=1 Tax=Microbulbifer sp. 2205BS26-8 TaxID=3064386 RepID=UPI00273E19B4|nr:hypothetical protein [Microbulbifer sp. 2205BS26-8]MDP5211015.1 hypothetical protein [Microbulbifer sp. 2205BS26-8]
MKLKNLIGTITTLLLILFSQQALSEDNINLQYMEAAETLQRSPILTNHEFLYNHLTGFYFCSRHSFLVCIKDDVLGCLP